MKKGLTLKKIFIICIMLALSICLIFGTILAFFSTKIEDEVTGDVGNAEVILEETYPDTGNVYGEEATQKLVRGHSIAEKPVYVRINCIPIVEYLCNYEEDGEQKSEWRTTSANYNNIEINFSGADWIEQDGKYYYNKILRKDETTTDLQIDWKLLSIPAEFVGMDVRMNVKVILEYAQSSNKAWQSIFEIENLPNGVEESE